MPREQNRIGPSRYWPVWEAGFLLTVLQLLWGGYRFGAGNQAIQVVFLKHLINPALYARDPLIATLPSYPTVFLRLLAKLIPMARLPEWYFALQALTVLAALAAVYCLATTMFRSRTPGILAVVMLLAGHHQALASTTLYWQQFTHTWVAFTGVLFVLVLFFRDRPVGAFLLTGLLFNVHALLAGYALAILALAAVSGECRLGLKRGVLAVAGCACLAAPTLLALLQQPHAWDAEWLRLVHIRSAAHSFPLTWWQPGRTEIARFVLIAALAVVAMGGRMPARTRRRTAIVLAACLMLFVAAVVGSELVSVPTVIRAQLLRSSSLLLLVFVVLIARGIADAWRRGARPVAPWSVGFRRLVAGFVLATMVFPGLINLLPVALLGAALASLAAGRLSVPRAAVAGGALLVAFAAHRDLHFPLISLPSAPFVREALLLRGWETRMTLLALAAVALSRFLLARRWTAWLLRPAAGVCAVALLGAAYLRLVTASERDDTWVQAQRWARQHTPVSAVFLTPPAPGGFRVHSERAIVSEWRDGTQQYFDPTFARLWWQRMEALQPGLRYDASGCRQLDDGQSLTDLADHDLEALCRRFGASYLVLPARPARNFIVCYRNTDWVIYSVERPPTPPPADALTADVWRQQEEFRERVVLPNIRRYRTSEVSIGVVNTDGAPLSDVPFRLSQTDSLFRFGSALGYFIRPSGATNRPDRSAYDVTPRELEVFPQICNFSITGYSAKWAVMEPERGHPYYEDLDRYVEWCRRHGVRVQIHFVTGYAPRWLKALPAEEQEACLVARARALVERYGDRVDSWQVINEKHLLKLSPAAFKTMRELMPGIVLGISDCATFWSPKSASARAKEMSRGMLDQLQWLREQGVQVDFVGLHGHRPFQLWADMRDIYALFDTFAAEGVRIYVTEFGTETGSAIVGPVRGGTWTDELQARYYALIYETCYSHPAIDGINLWGIGPNTFVQGAGLLDESLQPKPAFETLRKLIRETWRTELSGNLGLDGTATVRAYHGDYTLTVSPPGCAPTNVFFRILPGTNTVFRFVVPDRKP